MSISCASRGCAAVSLVVAACSAAPQGVPAPSGDRPLRVAVRDSAGVRIVESRRPLWLDREGWIVDSVPELAIAVARTDSQRAWHWIVDAARVGRRIAILFDATSEVRWYDTGGHLLHTTGSDGEEVYSGTLCALADRRIAVSQMVVGEDVEVRTRTFGADAGPDSSRHARGKARDAGSEAGTPVSIETFSTDPEETRPPIPADCFPDGTLLLERLHRPGEDIPGTVDSTAYSWSRARVSGADEVQLALQTVGLEYLLPADSGRPSKHAIPFTTRPSVAPAKDGVYIAAGADPVIQRRRLDGSLDLLIRWTPAARVRSAEILERHSALSLEAYVGFELMHRNARRFFQMGAAAPEWIASVQTLRVDAGGRLWAERYRPSWDSVAVWDVFDTEGAWLGGVIMPPNRLVHEIGEDYVLTSYRDEQRVARLAMYRLVRRAR